eukprot:gene7789-10583_t
MGTCISCVICGETNGDSNTDTWSNCIGRQTVKPFKLCTPTSLDELVAILKEAAESARKVHAAGVGHSFSDVMTTYDGSGILIDIRSLKGFPEIDISVLNDDVENNEELLCVAAGETVHSVNSKLDQNNLGLNNMGAYTFQTFIGAISTGTHGTGAELGNIATSVSSILLVCESGVLRQIEPSNGITNRVKFEEKNKDNIELIQDDDVFQSIVVSLGCMGVIYSVIIRARPAYYLMENRTMHLWKSLSTDIPELLNRIQKNRHYEIDINPYATVHGHHCIETVRNIDPNATHPHGDRGVSSWIAGQMASWTETSKLLVTAANDAPSLVPEMNLSALNSMVHKGYIDKSYKVLDLGNVNDLKAYANEIAFPLEFNEESLKNVIHAVDKILDIAEKNFKKGRVQMGPVALRFVGPSNGYLSPEYGRHTVRMELDMLDGIHHGITTLNEYQVAMKDFGGIPHWGLEFNQVNANDYNLIQMYPHFDKWVKVFHQFNNAKHKTFANALTDRLGITTPPVANTPVSGV